MSQKNVLLIFVKNPEKGEVKTRLAKTIGDEKALEVYKKLLAYTRQTTQQITVDRQIWYSEFIPEKDEWDGRQFVKKVQQGDDLGQKMINAFSDAFDEGYSKAVIIGSDCAELTAKIVEEAYSSLDESELVIGPSEDGGYYLLGMRKFNPEILEEIQWSTSKVFSQTLQVARQLGLRTKLLPELNDVDYEEDWKSVKDQL